VVGSEDSHDRLLELLDNRIKEERDLNSRKAWKKLLAAAPAWAVAWRRPLIAINFPGLNVEPYVEPLIAGLRGFMQTEPTGFMKVRPPCTSVSNPGCRRG